MIYIEGKHNKDMPAYIEGAGQLVSSPGGTKRSFFRGDQMYFNIVPLLLGRFSNGLHQINQYEVTMLQTSYKLKIRLLKSLIQAEKRTS